MYRMMHEFFVFFSSEIIVFSNHAPYKIQTIPPSVVKNDFANFLRITPIDAPGIQ